MATVTLKGKSGKAYEFEVYGLDSNLNAVAGVYAVTGRRVMITETAQDSYSHTAIYFGQTSDLDDRFSDHHKADCFKDHGANSLCFHADGDDQSRLAKESDLIEAAYNPPCNN